MDTFRHFSSFLLVAGKRWPVLFDPCDIDRVSPDFYLVFMALVFLLIGVGDQRAPIKSFRNPGRHFAKKKNQQIAIADFTPCFVVVVVSPFLFSFADAATVASIAVARVTDFPFFFFVAAVVAAVAIALGRIAPALAVRK